MALAQSPAHQALLATAQRVLPGGSNGNVLLPPEQAFVIAAGQGTRVYDVEGHCWIDYLLGSGPMILEHAHPEVLAAVQAQLTDSSPGKRENARQQPRGRHESRIQVGLGRASVRARLP